MTVSRRPTMCSDAPALCEIHPLDTAGPPNKVPDLGRFHEGA